MPAGAINQKEKLWRFKKREGKKRYIFNRKALAKVFRAKMFDTMKKAALPLPNNYPTVSQVGSSACSVQRIQTNTEFWIPPSQ